VIYLHVFQWKTNELSLPALPAKVLSATLLSGEKVSIKQTASGFTLSVPTKLQDSISTIIKLEIDKPAISIPIIDPLVD
jgi:alpha-L-fucosidase